MDVYIKQRLLLKASRFNNFTDNESVAIAEIKESAYQLPFFERKTDAETAAATGNIRKNAVIPFVGRNKMHLPIIRRFFFNSSKLTRLRKFKTFKIPLNLFD